MVEHRLGRMQPQNADHMLGRLGRPFQRQGSATQINNTLFYKPTSTTTSEMPPSLRFPDAPDAFVQAWSALLPNRLWLVCLVLSCPPACDIANQPIVTPPRPLPPGLLASAARPLASCPLASHCLLSVLASSPSHGTRCSHGTHGSHGRPAHDTLHAARARVLVDTLPVASATHTWAPAPVSSRRPERISAASPSRP